MLTGAVMVPHPPIAVHEIGKGEERKIQATEDAYEKASEFIAAMKPETLIVISPHAVLYRDWFNVSSGSEAYGDFGQFGCSRVSFTQQYDETFTSVLTDLCRQHAFPAGTQYDRDKMLDHGTMVPLYFINQKYRDYKLVRISLSGFSLRMHYQFGMYIRQVIESLEKRTVIVASGDLSHCQKADGPYGFKKEGPVYDEQIMQDMCSASFEHLLEYDPAFLEEAMECGHRSFTMLAGALDRTAVHAHALSHEAVFGVGYGIVLYDALQKEDSRNFLDQYEAKERNKIASKSEDAWITLARNAIAAWVKEKKWISVPDDLPEEMEQQAGVFVSIYEDGMLRGCIGTIEPVRKNIAEEIISNAVSACSRDPRFTPVEESELPYLEISVDVLGKPERIKDKTMLDPKRYGIICSKDNRRGLLLPDLDGVDTIDEQIAIACRKAGIDQEESFEMQRFEVVRHEAHTL